MGFFRKLFDKFNTWLEENERKNEEFKRQKSNEAHDIFINSWGMDTHCQDEQIARFKRGVVYNELSKNGYLDYHSLSTSFRSRTDKNVTYKTTLERCTCPDFQHRNLPCKHMYKLAYLLGAIDTDWDLSGVPSDICQKIESLPPQSYNLYKKIISENKSMLSSHTFLIKNNRNLYPIFDCNLLSKENPEYAYNLDKMYSKNDLIAAITTSGSDLKITSKTTKQQLIDYIIASDNKSLIKLKDSYIRVCFPEEIISNLYYIYRKYHEKTIMQGDGIYVNIYNETQS